MDPGKPFIYIRSSAKGHGMGNLIEGEITPGKSVVVVEDLVSTGGSSLKAVAALREAGYDVKGMVAIFTYGFQLAEDNFKESDCKLATLSNYNSMIERAVESNYISENDVDSLKEWRNDPSNWMK